MRTIQIYGQNAWHDSAVILSDRDGLLALRGAIDRLLQTDKVSEYVNCYVSDGEGYHLFISKIDNSKEWAEAELPYQSDIAKSQKAGMLACNFISIETLQEARKWKND